MSGRRPFPLKVAVFTAGSIAAPVLSYLSQENLLAGVVLANRQGAVDPQFVAELNKNSIPHTLLAQENVELFIKQCKSWEANLGFVLGFPSILPDTVLKSFEYGIYNLHPSALPKYRGAMPLYWLIRNQETATNITIHKVETQVDSGGIVLQQNLEIHPRDTFYSLAIQVAQHAPLLLGQLLQSVWETGDVMIGKPQHGEASNAPRPTPTDIAINWSCMSAEQIVAITRAGNPTIGATSFIRQVPVTVFQATKISEVSTHGTPPGTLVHIGEPEGCIVAANEGAVRLDIVSTAEGLFGGIAFAERFQLDAGMRFETPL